jgi:hypothetical protein
MAGYGTDDGFAAWLSGQGLAIPDDAPAPAVLRQIGSDYVDAAYGHLLMCSQKTGGWEQERAFPRTGHRVGGQLLPDDLIPSAWIHASYRAAWLEATNPGWATNPVTPGRITKREQVDVISREFFGPDEVGGGASTAPGFPSDAVINGLVLPWLCSGTRRADSLFRVI